MDATLNLRLLAGFIGFGFSAFAQIDGAAFATDLRAKYGPPRARETFTVRPGIEMVVNYAFSGHVCRIELPPIGPERERPGVLSPQAIDDFLAELIPLTMRGKELNRGQMQMGLHSESIVEYENLAISVASHAERLTGVTVSFKNEVCRDQPTP